MRPQLHRLPSAELVNLRISDHSFWNDDRWIFDNPTEGQLKHQSTIRWDIVMPDGDKLTDPNWFHILDPFKRLIWSLWASPSHSKNYKPGMMADFQKQVAYFARWMAVEDYASFCELDAPAFEYYADAVLNDFTPNGSDRDATATGLLRFLRIPHYIWVQSDELRLSGVVPPKDPPYGGLTPFAKAKQLAVDTRGSIPPVPDDVFLQATSTALRLLDDDADDIIGAFHLFLHYDTRHMGRSRAKQIDFMEAYEREVQSLFPRAVRHFIGSGRWRVWWAISTLRTACVILIQALIGLRASELCGLRAGHLNDGLPGCITVRGSVSGLHEIFYVKGRVYKTQTTWAEHEWVAGLRPINSSYLPIPVRAAQVLERLFRPVRTASKVDHLALFATNTKNGQYAKGFLKVDSQSILRGQKLFFSTFLPESNWRITTHQWRKAFAQFVIRADASLMPGIKDHFHHMSIAMTELGYLSSDPEMSQLIDEAAIASTVSFFGELVTGGKRHFGPVAAMIQEAASRIGIQLGNRDTAGKATDLRELVCQSGMRVHDLNFGGKVAGNCVYRPGTGRCTEGCLARWVMPAPLWAAACPDVCWECENLLVCDDHQDFWVSRLRHCILAHRGAKEAGDLALALLYQTRIAQCAVVLEKMGVRPELEAFDAKEA